MPLYLQVAKLMRQKIESQEWGYEQQIPTLDQLATEFDVSRITLRAALNLLEENGIVRRTRGVGTFVAKDLSEQRWFKLANNFDELVTRVSGLKIRMLPIDHEVCSPELPIPFGKLKKVYQRLLRLHYRDDVPYCVIDLYLDKTVFDKNPSGFQSAPVVPQLASRDDVDIHTARQIMHITVSDRDTAAHLNIGVGDPIAEVSRAFMDIDGEVLYYAHIQYPAHLIQIDTDLLQRRTTSRAHKESTRQQRRAI